MENSIGRIIFASKNQYIVLTDDGEYLARISGTFLRECDTLPTVGDNVDIQKNLSGDSVILRVHERRSEILRRAAGSDRKASALAANVDIMLIVNAMDRSFSKRRIERFIVLARTGGVRPVIVLSKADLCSPLDMAVYMSDAEEVAGGADVITVSSQTGEGMKELENMLGEGVTACAVGLSGAGKSSILNRLSGLEMNRTEQVRESDSRGRHCTTDRHMFRLPTGAMFIDSPGIREVGLTGDAEAVEDTFDEIKQASEACFFADCTHTHEPSCAVIAAVANGIISRERYDSYLKLKRESESFFERTEEPQKKKQADRRLSRLIKSVNKQKKRF